MRISSRLSVGAATALALGAGTVALAGGSSRAGGPTFTHPQRIDNPYLPITTAKRCEHRGEEHDGTRTRAVQTVLAKTRRFDVNGQRVDAVVVRDNSFVGGKLVETAFDYFAQADDGTVYYLGEHVNNLRNGKVIDHNGTWLLGRQTDVPGVAMPGDPQLGDQYRFEDVPGVTAESNRVEEVGMRAKVSGRLHTGVIRIQEFIQPEGEIEYKLYAPGVGKITEYAPDGRAVLRGCL